MMALPDPGGIDEEHVMSLDPTGTGQKRWMMLWKAALNAFGITFDGRLSAGRK